MFIPFRRHRRLRRNETILAMIREHHISMKDIIYPIFVTEGEGVKREVPSMPGVFQFSLDQLGEELNQIHSLQIPAIMLFGVPDKKDAYGSQADASEGITQRAIKHIKSWYPQLYVIADTCLCSYTDHGHCGVLEKEEVVNDPSLERLVQVAISQARAGADMVAPSNMMDGFVYAIRQGLDQAGFEKIPILSYSVKYASYFYGPFRHAAECAPQFGDRRSYQMDPANAREALREAASDVEEGADMLMVKPGLPYLDVIYRLKERFDLPVVAYQVSGEYAMLKAAAQNGWISEKEAVLEVMYGFKRAGADMIITYYAKELASWLGGTR